MTVEGPRDISGLIAAWGDGDEQALRSLMSAVYPELRRIARQHLGRRHAGHTLESAARPNWREWHARNLASDHTKSDKQWSSKGVGGILSGWSNILPQLFCGSST